MNRNLYIAEILESVDLIISDKANAAHKKNKFILDNILIQVLQKKR